MGVNIIRLQFNWEAYERMPGVYDEGYLNYYSGVVDQAGVNGLYVIIDIHQDAFSRWTLDGCGEGFPRWAISKDTPLDEPSNGAKCWFWPLRVMLERSDIEGVFNKFYMAGNPARQRYLLLLEKLAQRFAGLRHVIGYDLLNEPLGKASLIEQLYVDGIAHIRRHDPSAIAFIEPEMLTGSGLETTRLTPPPINNLAFAPHYYDPTIYASIWLGLRYEPVAARNRELARRWGAALLLGEFGSPAFMLAPAYVRMIYDNMDAFGDSGTQWTWTPEWTPEFLDGWNRENLSVVDDKGRLRANYQERPYVQRTAGRYGTFIMTPAERNIPASAQYVWINNPNQGTTEIFVPTGFFGDRAPVVHTSAEMQCTFKSSRRILGCGSGRRGALHVELR